MAETTPIRPTDDEARTLARALIESARFGALGVIEQGTGAPLVTRIGVATASDGVPVSLVSDLSHHTRALRANPACSLLLGEPGGKGDPLVHPRLTVQARAAFVDRADPGHADLRARYLSRQPKARLYIDFGDFHLVRLEPTGAYLNGGFGKAFVLAPDDLAPR
jgi:putative heme iron utilization protein